MDERLPYGVSISALPDVLVQKLPDGGSIFLNLTTEEYFGLDPVGTSMYAALIESTSVEHAYQRVLEEFDVAPEQLRCDLAALVGKLVDGRLVEFRES